MQDRGFTLVEVLVALSILIVAALATAQMMSAAALAINATRTHTITAGLAAQRMEQLLAVEWTSLVPTPPNALDENVAGCVEFLDRDGRVVGTGVTPTGEAAFVRRWAIAAPAEAPDARVLSVLVRALASDLAGARGHPGEARLLTVRARVDQ